MGARRRAERLLRRRSNFRSAKRWVECINQCFSAILPHADDRDRGAIAFRPSESAMGPQAGSGSVTLKGFVSRREEADAIAGLIGGQSASYPEWRIAVLVRA